MKAIKYTIYSFLMASILLTTACEDHFIQEVNSDQLKQDAEQLVVHAFISPQNSRTEVLVTRSAPLVGTFSINEDQNPVPPVTNAKVLLSDGDKTVQLTYQLTREEDMQIGQKDEYHYVVSSENMPIVAGKNYTLTVSTPDGKEVTATTTVPGTTPEMEWELKTEVPENVKQNCMGNPDCIEGSKYFVMELEWNDPQNQANYYRLMGHNTFMQFASYEPVIEIGLISIPYYNNQVVNDLLTSDGKIYKEVDLQQPLYGRTKVVTSTDTIYTPIIANVILLHSDEHYYKYHKSLEARIETGDGDDPFSEPVPIYSNIEGGYGVFASYQERTISLELPVIDYNEYQNM